MADDATLVDRLVERSDAERARRPMLALELAHAGCALAAAVDRRTTSTGVWLALQMRAWAVTASAERALGALDRAEAALNVALGFLGADRYPGERRALDQARTARRAAYIRSDQGRTTEALALIDDAAETFVHIGRPKAAATCRVDQAAILATGGRTTEAIGVLTATLEQGFDQLSPFTRAAAVHNMALYLHEIGGDHDTQAEALRWLSLAMRTNRRRPMSVDQLKLLGMWGLMAVRVGDIDGGLQALERAAEGFARLGAIVPQASALLDLVRLTARHRRPDGVRRAAGRLFPLLNRLHAHPEIRAGLVQILRAIDRGELRPPLVERVRGALRALEKRRARERPVTG